MAEFDALTPFQKSVCNFSGYLALEPVDGMDHEQWCRIAFYDGVSFLGCTNTITRTQGERTLLIRLKIRCG
jgi:hypothetical protein